MGRKVLLIILISLLVGTLTWLLVLLGVPAEVAVSIVAGLVAVICELWGTVPKTETAAS